jgi:hypothetical protein
MKYYVFTLSIFVLVSFSSCNKSYICECLNPVPNTLEQFDLKKPNKKEAEKECAAKTGELINCHLK